MKCPGQDMRYWKPGDIFDVACPQCGSMVEFFKDESKRRCRQCGNIIANPRMDLGCAAHCRFAADCVGVPAQGTSAGQVHAPAPNARSEAAGQKDIGRNRMKVKRKIIEIDEGLCTGCGECVSACAEGALQLVEGKAKLVSEIFCDGLGACLGECPAGALTITERDSEEFNAAAVEEHLEAKPGEEQRFPQTLACGCPSQEVQVFPAAGRAQRATEGEEPASALTHWPVQIRLVPANAPFLKNADLLVAADCTPLAYAGFHRNLLPGKVVMLGCPKFDDADEYTRKFAEIFATANIRSITVVEMEVPCCAKLPLIVRNALLRAQKDIPLEEIVISRRGDVVERPRKATA